MKAKSIKYLRHLAGAAIFLSVFADIALADKAAKLPAYKVDLSQTSVSGLSSGAFMAAQFHTAFSGTLVGAGIVAGGPFYCSGSAYPMPPSVTVAQTACMNPSLSAYGPPDPQLLLRLAKGFEQSGTIDQLDLLKSQKVYLFSGKADKTVATAVVDQATAFYQLAGVPAQNIKYVQSVNAGHAIITNNAKDVVCADTQAPYINDCDFIQSQDILKHIYGDLQPALPALSGKIVQFDQSEFIKSGYTSMSDDAYLYVPKACEAETCKVHVAFHGCEQGAEKIGNLFYGTTGYNELADANKIIVLYPQAKASYGFFTPLNPKGCWDFWGYSDPLNPLAPNFYSKTSPQMSAVKAMLDRLGQSKN
ncbi:extracellular catalytic domain type 2 short-chain-length polyhydroxyalkanoate depolymerase [Janthinobacterium sp. B9-8]|uniref:extracellular catalytic domain type 2 short-chain-length polyhydroxyalkanoate depolymerase n=1 Tax=Janthinobacterium sp. B9-8 TaxID=1236179 RepID=UPI00061D2B7E|nr:poly(3-hydroxybutyrate) depolymerase [Janthinobacterium sp. B9-8]AMC33759.1 poly(3-hydroxybutyrate) depolymerase [Janthinobacterium sp. B9-8]